MAPTKQHGGKRAGAGRKPVARKRVTLSVTVDQETASALKYARYSVLRLFGATPGRIIDTLVQQIMQQTSSNERKTT